MAAVERWILTYEGDIQGCRVTAAEPGVVGRRIEIGREGQMPIAVTVPSTAVSRRAIAVTPTDFGWKIDVLNRNGAVVHPWGQAPELAPSEATLNWPLVGLRLLPDSPSSQHWVLFEADHLPVTPAGAVVTHRVGIRTDKAQRPSDLPPGEREALQTVFADLLAWPPRQLAEPLLLKQGATRIGISISALQDRLKSARDRARKLGLNRDVALTDPSYLYMLVRGGYLEAPTVHQHRLDRR